jgi:phage/plasmid-like protein (TIGR03299 family)
MALAGHDFIVVEEPVAVPYQWDGTPEWEQNGAVWSSIEGWKALRKNEGGPVLNVVKNSYTVIQNSTGWDVVDAIVGQGAKYETGITLKEGAVCSVLAWLDEPVQIPGDDALLLPFLNTAWAHDGSAALTARPTTIRTVCSNTQNMAELQGKRLGVEYTFRHTKNVGDRIEEAKQVLKGLRKQHSEFVELARELAELPVTPNQRTLFVSEFIPMPPEATISPRVKKNVEDARGAMLALFNGKTIPEEHRLTGYGLHLAGVEYLDHLRGSRNADTKYGRALMRNEPAKAKIHTLIKDVVKV